MASPLRFIENLLASGLAGGTPLLMATTGELLAERSGVLNLGVEGMMLLGASVGYYTTVQTGSLALGVLAAMAAAAALATLHAGVTVSLAGDQVVSGLGLGFLGSGLASVLGAEMVQVRNAPRLPALDAGSLADIPVIGTALLQQNMVVFLGLALIPATWFYLYRTRRRLSLRRHPPAPPGPAGGPEPAPVP